MAKVQEIGPYSAYAIAVKYGYKGTEEEWVKEQEANREASEAAAAAAAQSAKDAAASASGVAQSGQQAVQSIKDAQTAAEQAIETAKQDAVQAAQTEAEKASASAGQAASSAAEAAQSATNAAAEVGKVQSAGTAAVQAVQTAQNTATEAVSDAQQTATQAVSKAQATAVSAVQEAGTTQTSAVSTAASSALSGIADAKDAALSDVAQAGAEQVSAVGTAGTSAVQGVNDAKTAALEAIDAANAALPVPTVSDAGKVPTVNDAGTGYVLGEAQVDAYTKAESDARYAPIAAAIRPTASGNPVSITDSVEWPLLGLKVYGKSTQDGTPSPESPVPIVSAGNGGSIGLTVSDGADHSQSLTISTPNGLPGIPVDSDGNYTDASGQQRVCNYKDYARRVYVQRVERVTFDGSSDELWQMAINSITQRNYFQITLEKAALRINGNNVLLCSTFSYMGFGYAEPSGNNTACFTSNNVAFICSTSLFNSVDEWKQYLTENPMTLIYAIANPIETPLSEEEIAAYRTLHTYDGATVVSTAEDVAGLEVKYVADTQKYIDNRLTAAESHIQEIAAAQLNAQTGG